MEKKAGLKTKTNAKKTASKRSLKQTSTEKRIKEIKQQKEALQDQLLRTLAEMDNMRKRLDKERIQWIETANADLLRAMLPILDDLERSLKTSNDGNEFRQGIEMIYQKMVRMLTDKGVTPMESTGKLFDVEMHDALMQIEKKGMESGLVIEEHEKGYLLRGRVLRHAKVVVSK